MQLLDTGLVRDRRKGIGRAARRLGRVFTARPTNLIQLLGFGVVRFHLFVADRPCRRDAIVMPELAEVLLAKTIESRAIHLGGPTDEVVETGLERFSLLVVPGFLGNIAVPDKNLFYIPILLFPFQPVAAFEEEDALPRRRQMM